MEGLEVEDSEAATAKVRRTRPLPQKQDASTTASEGSGSGEADEVMPQEGSGCAAWDQLPGPAPAEEPPACIPGFREVAKTGVIYVMDQAARCGYSAATAHRWANLGQGSPETTSPKHWPSNVRKRLSE